MTVAQSLERPTGIVALAARLADLGYYPVPIPRGSKGPVIDGWQHLKVTPETAGDYFTEQHGVGVLHKNVLALDIDVYDPDLAAQIVAEAKRRFPGALERIGEAPKSALFFRMAEPGFKVAGTKKRRKGDLTAQIDVRSVSRQIVVYGIHPGTKQPYRWPNGELWATPWADLPEADTFDMVDFRDWCEALLKEWSGEEDQQAQIIDFGSHALGRGFADERASEESFIEALRYVSANVGYDEWLSALMGIHDYYNGSARGLEVAKQYSSPYSDYNPREVETKWKSFEPGKGITYRSIFHMAKQAGCDLSKLARKERKKDAPKINTDQPKASECEVAAPEKEDEKPKSQLEWFDDIEPSLSSNYLVKGLLDTGTMSVIYGPSNSGKTFFTLDLAYHIAIGAPWRGLRVKQASVLYLAAEGGKGVRNRISALKYEHGVCNVPMALRRAGLDLLQSEADLQHVYDLSTEVRDRLPGAPHIIVIDTLSRIMAGGDENSAADMTALIRNIDAIREATGAHIILVHHTGKDTARGARGHSSLRAATDTEIEVGVVGDEGEECRAAMVTKQRDYQGGETFAFTLKFIELGTDEDGDTVSSCVVEVADDEEFKAAKKAKKGLGGNQKIVAETFDQMVSEGLAKPNPGGVGFPDPGQFWTVQMEELREHCMGKFASANPRDAWRTAWAGVSDQKGLFCAASGLVWRIDRKTK